MAKKNAIKKIIVIQGPTASGKTALAIALAQQLATVVISADSRQFYQEMAIGTAKPSLEEQAGIPHYFIDSHSIHAPLTAATFEREALDLVATLHQELDVLILVGGSGLFIDALCYGLDDVPMDEAIKQQLNTEFAQHGLELLVEELKQKDPTYAAQADLQNPMRVIRALEVIRITGNPFSSYQRFEPKQRPFEILKFVIDLPREVLYERINLRVDQMVENGLVEEVKSLQAFQQLQALNTVGYAEIFGFLNGATDWETALELVKRNTRRYAKRQLTWFRRDEQSLWLKSFTTDNQLKEVMGRVNKA